MKRFGFHGRSSLGQQAPHDVGRRHGDDGCSQNRIPVDPPAAVWALDGAGQRSPLHLSHYPPPGTATVARRRARRSSSCCSVFRNRPTAIAGASSLSAILAMALAAACRPAPSFPPVSFAAVPLHLAFTLALLRRPAAELAAGSERDMSLVAAGQHLGSGTVQVIRHFDVAVGDGAIRVYLDEVPGVRVQTITARCLP